LVPAGDHPTQISGAVNAENPFIAILFYYAAQLGSDGVQGPVPGYALETSLSTLANPLEGVQKTLFGVDPWAQSPPPEAGANLVRAVRFLARVVRLYSYNLAVFDEEAHRTAAAAIHVAG
jgi:hypothetical protein